MQSINKKTGIYLAIGIMATLGFSHNAEALPGTTGAQANAISGTITKTVAGIAPTTTIISPVALSSAGSLGSSNTDDNSVGSATQTIYGVEVYNFLDVDNSTVGGAGNDQEFAEEKTGVSSLLGGLVKWSSSDDPTECLIDEFEFTERCAATETINGLNVNNIAVPLYTYPAGTSIPVNGTISDPQCSTGTETFSGYLILQESQYVIPSVIEFTIGITGMHLVGQATCQTSTTPLFTTTYDIRVAQSKGWLVGHLGPTPPPLDMNLKVILQ